MAVVKRAQRGRVNTVAGDSDARLKLTANYITLRR